MTKFYTENLADFGFREIKLLRDILDAWVENGLPDGFYAQNVRPAFNKNSGYVFLVNEDYQAVMLNDETLELFHSLPYSGEEGFLSELMEENNPDDLHPDDVEYILYAAAICGLELQTAWLEFEK